MYKIQNCMSGNLALVLERGSIILQSGKYFDLDGTCNRTWIKNNRQLVHLINKGNIRVVHDSEQKVSPAPIKDVVGADLVKLNLTIKKEDEDLVPLKSIIIDFSCIELEESCADGTLEDLPVDDIEIKELYVKNIDDNNVKESNLEDTKIENKENVCLTCGKICKSKRGKEIHMQVHIDSNE